MPSEKILEQKKKYVEELTERLKNASSGVIADFKGINVADDTKLRKDLREAGAEYFVAKNTMLHLAVEKAGLGELDELLSGTTAVALSDEDPAAAARVISKFAEKNKKYSIKGGYVEGKVIDADGVKSLAKLPDRNTLIAMTLGGLNAPITGLVYVLNANITGLARALQAIAEKKNA